MATLDRTPFHLTVPDTSTASPAADHASMRRHVVEAGESVYSIAADIAGGDGRLTMSVADAIVDANLGAEVGHGRRFTNPAYVEVGWVLLVPGPADPAAPPMQQAVAAYRMVEPPSVPVGDSQAPAVFARHEIQTLYDFLN